MELWKSEKKASKLLLSHFDKVIEGNIIFCEILGTYYDKGCKMDEEMVELVEKIHKKESEADKVLFYFEEFLFEGNILPNLREDLIKLAEKNDKIIDKIEAIVDFFTLQKIQMPESLRSPMMEIIDETDECLRATQQAIHAFFHEFPKTREHAELVNRYEHNIDTMERKLILNIFSLDISLAEKILLREFVNMMADVSDLTENVADRVQIMAIKRTY